MFAAAEALHESVLPALRGPSGCGSVVLAVGQFVRGRVVRAVHEGLGAAEAVFAIDVGDLAAGVYVVRAVAGGEAEAARLVVAR